jgi:hypothetical protein
MRRILVEHARAKWRLKRSGRDMRVVVDPMLRMASEVEDDVPKLVEAIGTLTAPDPHDGPAIAP